ncbi:MAG: radical SAM protein [Chloroflexi bacterium]|nr:radical SAM protein [Chloroflexota bacterium]
MEPCYLSLHRTGELDGRIAALYGILKRCTLCPRQCRKNRLAGEKGYCQSGAELVVSSVHPHFGEEDVLVGRERFLGTGGSGTIFLAGCNLLCLYCQNYEISFFREGTVLSPEQLAAGMMELQRIGCHNINWVTPTHYVPQLVRSLKLAIESGLKIPVVYNCGGYESLNTLKLLDGIVDIYMPDIKYSDPAPAGKFSNAPDYFERCREAVKVMHRQVGDLKTDSRGIAERGLLIRHLVLPNDLAGSEGVLRFIAEEVSTESYVNIMFQYRPLFKAAAYPESNRRPTLTEYRKVIETARSMGLHRGFDASP